MKENDAIYAKNSGKILSDKDKARVDQNTEKISEIMNSVADAENKAGLNLLGVKYADEDMNLRTFQTLQQELFNYQQEGLANYDQAFKLGATALEQRKSNDKNYTVFRFGNKVIRFKVPNSLEKYTAVKEWNNGYLVVMAKYSHNTDFT